MLHGWKYLTPEDRETILRGIDDNDCYGGPFHIEMQWTDRCNISCFFCNNDHLNQAGRELSPEKVQESLSWAQSQGLRSIRLAGGGDPLFHRHTPQLLRWLMENHIPVENLTTNGILLTEQYSEMLIQTGIDEILISLNYPTPETYAKNMRTNPANWQKVQQNILFIKNAMPPAGKTRPSIVLQFFLHSDTAAHIQRMYAIGTQLGVDKIAIKSLWNIDPHRQVDPSHYDQIKASLTEIIEQDQNTQLLDFGLTMNPELGAWCHAEQSRFNPKPTPERKNIEHCYIPWHSTTIRGSGELYPCCMLEGGNHGIQTLGNINQQPLSVLWHGKAYARLRTEMSRVILHRGRIDTEKAGFQHLAPLCADHYSCPFAWCMADPEFYKEAHRHNQRRRHSLKGLLSRFRS